ncbi:MAG: KdsC family phosphatase [Flavobacteriales bacterium Tduv]
MNDINTFVFDVDGVLTDSTLGLFPDGSLVRHMSTKDGYAIRVAQEKGYNLCIITGGDDLMVFHRLKNMGIRNIYLKIKNKIEKFIDYCVFERISPDKILYMGDDIPDIEVMQIVALPCAPKDAVAEVKAVSKYISPKKGGKGCVRDVIEQTLKIQGKWIETSRTLHEKRNLKYL